MISVGCIAWHNTTRLLLLLSFLNKYENIIISLSESQKLFPHFTLTCLSCEFVCELKCLGASVYRSGCCYGFLMMLLFLFHLQPLSYTV
jgi:hypothetical protein